MKRHLPVLLALVALSAAPVAHAQQPEYVTIAMDIAVDAPAEQAWDIVGGYCDISAWLEVDCTITSGDGGMGTVRDLAGGRVTEILVAKTPLSYGYTQPAVPGEFYDLYHGFFEARPVTDSTSRLLYTLVYDVSDMADEAAKQADMERRRGMFEQALANMKALIEGE